MNKQEAIDLLENELEFFRSFSHQDLKKNVDQEPITKEVTSKDGKKYQIEICTHWDDNPQGNIRVIGAIDDGGLRAFFPLSRDFIKSPKNEFIDE
ncbi:MAG: hypothetical protein VW455_13810 [Nitrospinota bacterium]